MENNEHEPEQNEAEPETLAAQPVLPKPMETLSPTVQKILTECDLVEMAPSLCFRCQEATVLQMSSPDGVQNSAVVRCAAMNRDIQVIVKRCTSHLALPAKTSLN